jgi:hypothetical protein
MKSLESANHGIIPFSAHSNERGLTVPVGYTDDVSVLPTVVNELAT